MPYNLGPYKYQRTRQLGNKEPRPPQPAIQPNKRPPVIGWGMLSLDYWREVSRRFFRERGI